MAGAYVAVNDESGRIDYVSVNQLQSYSGIIFFPTAAKSELFNYRFVLPLNSRESIGIKGFRAAAAKESSIFNKLPFYGKDNQPPFNEPPRSQVKQNRLDAANLAADAAISNASMVSDWVRRVLAK